MVRESDTMNFYIMVFGITLNSHVTFMKHLKERLHLQEVPSEDESDIIYAFVPIVSRAGTDIEAALQRIPQSSRPVVLVVLHHTNDQYFVAPDSRLCVDRSNVFTVDCLFHEDRDLLRCQQNDKALQAVTDHLMSIRSSVLRPDIPTHKSSSVLSNVWKTFWSYARLCLKKYWVFLGAGLIGYAFRKRLMTSHPAPHVTLESVEIQKILHSLPSVSTEGLD